MTERSAAELQDEARLIEAAKRDRKAFAALYDRYFDQIYSYCYYHSGRREEAEDLASETFQRALEGLTISNGEESHIQHGSTKLRRT